MQTNLLTNFLLINVYRYIAVDTHICFLYPPTLSLQCLGCFQAITTRVMATHRRHMIQAKLLLFLYCPFVDHHHLHFLQFPHKQRMAQHFRDLLFTSTDSRCDVEHCKTNVPAISEPNMLPPLVSHIDYFVFLISRKQSAKHERPIVI